ncbi:hypothetical protein LOTGIDRAFT_128432 [Lottia gigantea]|uniref:Alpha-L-iduronidase n=1 Tax=Lottia gigantea TaxID=225164 RepID=V3ZW24_LOTGI|nr:hypothetical protein LOTGIDRAFT_128432 [Lottia gigantea]ESO86810.1 hypothetical protein LOTGIDRAFT_128432 [Lottia gigantea]
MYLKVNSDDVRGTFQHFWRSTGFCPPLPHHKAHDFDLSKDMKQNLAYIGAVPHRGIEQVRIHWLLDLITVPTYSTEGQPEYNFTYLNQLIYELYRNGLKPGFEVMGNPSNVFTDFENKTQVYMWKDLIKLIATSYIQEYGLDYVKSWNFEVWNEPDCEDFDMKFTLKGFANYYDATSEGLMQAHPDLIFGGPAGGCGTLGGSKHHGHYELYLLNHIVFEKNYFSDKIGTRVDFISLHKKGDGKAMNIIEDTIASMKNIGILFPTLANKPFYNDEADPMVGWSKDLAWRADSIYGAMVVKIIAQHQNIFRANPDSPVNFQLLSNDNGFLSYYPYQFTQRTLVARFQINNTSPRYTTFVQKPVHAAMVMLSKLGNQQVYVGANDSNNGALATVYYPSGNDTSDSWQMSILVYDSNDTDHGSEYGELELDWYINPPDPKQGYAVFALGNDPYGVWVGLDNKTAYPTQSQWDYIRLQEPVKSGPGKVLIPPRWQILQPEATLLHLCAKSDMAPEQVTGLRFINITVGQVLVIWSDDNIKTKCIYTYEVAFSPTNITGPYQRVNKVDTIATISVISPHPHDGYYKVRAVDYWKRTGFYSNAVYYPEDIPV